MRRRIIAVSSLMFLTLLFGMYLIWPPSLDSNEFDRPCRIERYAADLVSSSGIDSRWARSVQERESRFAFQKNLFNPIAFFKNRPEVDWGNKVTADIEQDRPTNLVIIMTDNHGAWTLGCYGNKDIKSPHIDKLAKEGLLFERAFACNAVCSPTRATFFTGLMPSQHGVHCFLRAKRLQTGPDARCTISQFTTLPGVLSKQGYFCGLIGKWHLGGNMTPQVGFSTWVTTPHGGTIEFYDQQVIENNQMRKEPTYLTKYWTDRGCKFIDDNKKKPFFLFLSYNGPYGLGRSMHNVPKNRHAEHYKNKELPSFPREKMHPWMHSTKDLFNNKTSRWRYAAEISAVDDGVGRIMATLKKNKLDDNTLIVFLADQGLSGGHGGIWGMGDHTRPLSAFDSTKHIPLIFRHKGQIPAGKRSPRIVANYDMLRTLLSYLGHGNHLPAKANSPSRDFSPMLRGKKIDWEDVAFYEFEHVRAMRTPDWNYVERIKQKPNELYDVKNDPDQRKNLSGQKKFADAEKRLQERLHTFFDRYTDRRWDLWRGGGSQSMLLGNVFGKKK